MLNPHTTDKEMEVLLARAESLRLTINEICDYCGVNRVKLWRWRHEASPRFADRQAFIERLQELIETTKQEYMDA